MSNSTPQAPEGMSGNAVRLWNAVLNVLDLDEHELLTLESMCREQTWCDRLEAEMENDGSLLVKGSGGGLITNPLLVELRYRRESVMKHARMLNLHNLYANEENDNEELPDNVRQIISQHVSHRKAK